MESIETNTTLISLDDKNISIFKPYSTIQNFKKNEYVFQASSAKKYFYILIRGRVKLCRVSSAGREVMQWFCFPGEIFGISEIHETHQHAIYAQCCETCEVYAIPINQFQEFINHSPEIAMKVIEQLSVRLKILGDSLLNFTSDCVKTRLIKLLTRLKLRFGVKYKNGMLINVKLTHKEISDMVGACRQSVTTALGELKSEGYIEVVDNLYYIPSIVRLENLIDKESQEEVRNNKVKKEKNNIAEFS